MKAISWAESFMVLAIIAALPQTARASDKKTVEGELTMRRVTDIIAASGIKHFVEMPGCDRAAFQEADHKIELGGLRANETTLKVFGRDIIVDSNRGQGSNYLKLAEAAADKGCQDMAHSTYLKVIDTFTGSAYESLRQHAMVGLDDLRSRAVNTQASPDGQAVSRP